MSRLQTKAKTARTIRFSKAHGHFDPGGYYTCSSKLEYDFNTSLRRTDIHVGESNNLVTATFDLPGLQKQDVHIELRDSESVLSISGQALQSEERKDEKGGYVVRERREGRFSRAVPVAKGTKPSDVQAKMENGVLTVTFPYKSPEQEAKRITIA